MRNFIQCVWLAATMVGLSSSARAQSGLYCGSGDYYAQDLVRRAAKVAAGPDARARIAIGIGAAPADSITVAADSVTCARAASAVNAAMAHVMPAFAPKPDSLRLLYVVRVADKGYVVWDPDERLLSESGSKLWWFAADLAQFLSLSNH